MAARVESRRLLQGPIFTRASRWERESITRRRRKECWNAFDMPSAGSRAASRGTIAITTSKSVKATVALLCPHSIPSEPGSATRSPLSRFESNTLCSNRVGGSVLPAATSPALRQESNRNGHQSHNSARNSMGFDPTRFRPGCLASFATVRS